MGQLFSSLRPPWWFADDTNGVNAGALRGVIEQVRCYFSEYNLARLMVELLLQKGMTFYTASTEGTFVLVPKDLVIMILSLAIETSYDNAVQQFCRMFNQMEDNAPPTVSPPQQGDGLAPYLNGMDWIDEEETSGSDVINSSRAVYEALPPGAVMLDPRGGRLTTTVVLRHVVDQVRSTYSRSNLAHHIWQMVFRDTHEPERHHQGLAFIERALEMGYDEALQVPIINNPMRVAADATVPDDESSLGTISVEMNSIPDDLEYTFD